MLAVHCGIPLYEAGITPRTNPTAIMATLSFANIRSTTKTFQCAMVPKVPRSIAHGRARTLARLKRGVSGEWGAVSHLGESPLQGFNHADTVLQRLDQLRTSHGYHSDSISKRKHLRAMKSQVIAGRHSSWWHRCKSATQEVATLPRQRINARKIVGICAANQI